MTRLTQGLPWADIRMRHEKRRCLPVRHRGGRHRIGAEGRRALLRAGMCPLGRARVPERGSEIDVSLAHTSGDPVR